jgi:hypothetical protein
MVLAGNTLMPRRGTRVVLRRRSAVPVGEPEVNGRLTSAR